MKDWNDAYKAGVDIRAMADKVNAYKGDNVVPLHASPYTLICLADVDVEPVEWLWDNRPGQGKDHDTRWRSRYWQVTNIHRCGGTP